MKQVNPEDVVKNYTSDEMQKLIKWQKELQSMGYFLLPAKLHFALNNPGDQNDKKMIALSNLPDVILLAKNVNEKQTFAADFVLPDGKVIAIDHSFDDYQRAHNLQQKIYKIIAKKGKN